MSPGTTTTARPTVRRRRGGERPVIPPRRAYREIARLAWPGRHAGIARCRTACGFFHALARLLDESENTRGEARHAMRCYRIVIDKIWQRAIAKGRRS